jgi:hypothetical protein
MLSTRRTKDRAKCVEAKSEVTSFAEKIYYAKRFGSSEGLIERRRACPSQGSQPSLPQASP